MDRSQRHLTTTNFLMVPGTESNTYSVGRLKYFYAGWEAWNSWLASYSYNPDIVSASINGNVATVDIVPYATETIAGSGDGPVKWPATSHQLTLENMGGHWLVSSDTFSDYFLSSYGAHPNWAALMSALPGAVQQLKSEAKSHAPQIVCNFNCGGTYVTYNRTAAADYAVAHTNDCHCYTDYTNYNPLFVNYAPTTQNDCQNFVSQSVWAGFGGQDTATAIDNHEFPMIDNVAGAANWWADANTSDGGSVGPWNWANVGDFKTMIENNYNNNLLGVQGTTETATSVQLGDYAIDSSLEPNGHAEFITQVGSTPGWGNIAFSEHTHNAVNWLYIDAYGPTQPSTLQFMWIATYRSS